MYLFKKLFVEFNVQEELRKAYELDVEYDNYIPYGAPPSESVDEEEVKEDEDLEEVVTERVCDADSTLFQHILERLCSHRDIQQFFENPDIKDEYMPYQEGMDELLGKFLMQNYLALSSVA